MNGAFLRRALVNLAGFFSEAGAHVFEVFFDVVVHFEQHFLKFRR